MTNETQERLEGTLLVVLAACVTVAVGAILDAYRVEIAQGLLISLGIFCGLIYGASRVSHRRFNKRKAHEKG